MARHKRGQGRDNGLRPTSGAEWRKPREEAQEGYVKELWSGMVARLRPPALDKLLASGRIPDILTPLVYRMVFYGIDDKTVEMLNEFDETRQSPERIADSLEFYRVICEASFVDPRIVDNPQADDEISIDDVPMADQMLVWELAVGGAAFLKTFHIAAIRDVEPVSDEQDNAQPAQPDDADSGTVDSVSV